MNFRDNLFIFVKKMHFKAILFVLFISNSLFAQNRTDSVTSNLNNALKKFESMNVATDTTIDKELSSIVGLKEIKSDKLDLLLQDYMDHKKVYGYRIQIFSSNTRGEAMKARVEFLNSYPEAKSYLVYQAPNFKVRVGDYRDRLTVNKNLDLIKENFPSAFIVKDEIEPVLE